MLALDARSSRPTNERPVVDERHVRGTSRAAGELDFLAVGSLVID
jgi:hypothetical protein